MECSVVIPAYNASNTIQHCIASCYAQILQPKEIVIVDDCSQDDTWQVILSLAATYITIPIICLRNEQNAGVAATRNIGILQAQYPFVALLDSDDSWHPDKLAVCLAVLHSNPGIPILFHDYSTETDMDSPVAFASVAYHAETVQEVIFSNKIQGSGIVFRRAAGIHFDPRFRYAEDLEFGIRYVKTASILHLEALLTKTNRLQLSAGGLSSNKWQMRKGEMQAFLTLARYHWKYYLFVPFLIGFSFLKFVRKLLVSGTR